MSADRMLRAGPGDHVVRSPYVRPADPRQAAFDLDLRPDPSAEETIYRLSYELSQLRIKLAGAGLLPSAPSIKVADRIAVQAAGFARRLAEVEAAAGDSEDDAAAVNARIAIVAEEADALIAALIENAEAQGMEAKGPWMKIPLVECQAFEPPDPGDPEAAEADDIRDQFLNSQ